MKKLVGMKKNFSSLENKKLENLQSILGGLGSSRNAQSGYVRNGQNVYDTDTYTDDTPGEWKYKNRMTVGEMVGSFEV